MLNYERSEEEKKEDDSDFNGWPLCWYSCQNCDHMFTPSEDKKKSFVYGPMIICKG